MVQIAHGGFVGNDDGTNVWEDTSLWDEYRALAGVQPAIVAWYQVWGRVDRKDWDQDKVDELTARGEVPFISWGPRDGVLAPGSDTAYNLASVRNGDHDAYIDEWADAVAAYERAVIFALMWEMNLSTYTWGIGVQSQTAQNYIDTWQYIVDRMRSGGATNAKWAFVPWANSDTYTSYYPGDGYVDYVGLDGFNNMASSTWLTANQVFDTAYTHLTGTVAPSKPFIVKEFASMDAGGDKAAWITDFYDTVQTEYPKTRLVIPFHQNRVAQGEKNWRFDTTTPVETAFQAAANRGASLGRIEDGPRLVGQVSFNSGGNNANLVAPKPTSSDMIDGQALQVNDILIFTINKGQFNDFSVPSGVTGFLEETDVNNVNGGNMRGSLLYRRVDGTEPSSWTFTAVSGTPTWQGTIQVYRGCIETGSPIGDADILGFNPGTGFEIPAASTFSCPTVTTGGLGRRVIATIFSTDQALNRSPNLAWATRYNESAESNYVISGTATRTIGISDTYAPNPGVTLTPEAVIGNPQMFYIAATFALLPVPLGIEADYERLPAATEISNTNLPNGTVADIDDDPTAPDANWKTAASDPTAEVAGTPGSIGPVNPNANTTWSGFAGQFTNPNNANGSTTGTYATSGAATFGSNYGNLYTFGTAFNAIPDDAEITGVTLVARHFTGSNPGRGLAGYQLASGGSLIGSEYVYSAGNGTTLPTTVTDATIPAGGLGAFPSVAQIKASTFGVRARVQRVVNNTWTYSLDRFQLTISYTSGGTPGEVRATAERVAIQPPSRDMYNHPFLTKARAYVRARRNGGSANPVAIIEMFETGGGTALQLIHEGESIASTTGEYVEGYLDPVLLSSLDAEDLEIQVRSPGAEAALLEVGAIDVYAALSPEIALSLTGASSDETTGTLTAVPGTATRALTGASSDETTGTLTPSPGATTRTLTGASSDESTGTLTPVAGTVTAALTGASSDESAGTLAATPDTATRALTGAPTEETEGTLTGSPGAATRLLAGASTEESPGSLTPVAGASSLALTGATTEETEGTLTPAAGTATAALTGAASDDSAGSLTAAPGTATRALTGAASDESTGTLTPVAADVSVALTGAASDESTGTLTASGFTSVALTGAASEESTGALTPAPGTATVELAGAASEESTGTIVATGHTDAALAGAGSDESAGALTPTPGTATVELVGADSDEAPGSISTGGVTELELTGAASDESTGTLTPVAGTATRTLLGADSDELALAGTLTPTPGAADAPLTGADSDEAAGTLNPVAGDAAHALAGAGSDEQSGSLTETPGIATLGLTGPASEEAAGTLASVPGNTSSTLAGAGSEEEAGSLTVSGEGSVGLVGAPSEETAGSLLAVAGDASAALAGAASEESTGALTPVAFATLALSGAPTEETTGSLVGAPGTATLALVGAGSEEQTGTLALSGAGFAGLTGATSEESTGMLAATPGAATHALAGAPSEESAGVLTFVTHAFASLVGATSDESSGTLLAQPGVAARALTGAPSEESAGSLTATPNAATRILAGAASDEATGILSATGGDTELALIGAESDESTGELVAEGRTTVALSAVTSEESAGTLVAAPGIALRTLIGAPSEDSTGVLGVSVSGVVVALVGTGSDELTGGLLSVGLRGTATGVVTLVTGPARAVVLIVPNIARAVVTVK